MPTQLRKSNGNGRLYALRLVLGRDPKNNTEGFGIGFEDLVVQKLELPDPVQLAVHVLKDLIELGEHNKKRHGFVVVVPKPH